MRKRAEELQNQAAGVSEPQQHSKKLFSKAYSYIVALHNKRTGAVSLLPSSRPPQILQRTVKALKSIQTADAPTTTHQQARNTLGETFGTKKAKAAIRAQERNKVDVGAMEGVIDYLMEGIEKGAEGLMTVGTSPIPKRPHPKSLIFTFLHLPGITRGSQRSRGQ
jgi:hypothetical protein